jgi:hypothetical protein
MSCLLNTPLANKCILKTCLEIVFSKQVLRFKKIIFYLVNFCWAKHILKVFIGSAQPYGLGSWPKLAQAWYEGNEWV